jgi:hypothetical protein
MHKKTKKILAIILAVALNFYFMPLALADGLISLSDTMSRLKISQASDHKIKYTTPSGVAAAGTMTITFPAGFTVGSVDYTDIDVSWGASTGYENELTLAGTASGTTWGAAFAGQVLTITSGSGVITATSKVIVEIGLNATGGNAQLTNPSSAATYVISIAGTFGDTGKIAVAIISDDTFTVNASVDPTITFAIDTTSVNFGTLSSTSVTTAVSDQTSNSYVRLTTSTNAGSGYAITVRDVGSGANPGLYNAGASYTIGSADYSYNNSANLDSVAGYGLQATSATATIASPYNVSSNNVGGFELTAQSLATYASVADGHTLDMVLKAKASGSTPAGNYVDSVTVIATANF